MGLHRHGLAAFVLFLHALPVIAFFEEFFGGGGGGGMQFEQPRPKRVKWPRGVPDECSKGMAWLKGTEWRWNRDDWTIKLEKNGDVEAPIQQCRRGSCKWSADKGKFYLLLGDAGLVEFDTQSEKPKDMNQKFRMRGRIRQDNQAVTLTFQKIYDFSAVDLDKDLYGALGLPDDADGVQIKKAYRKLSIQYHPDKAGADAQKFNDVRDAYEILNDPDKKILYDTGGMEAVQKADKGEIQKTDNFESKFDVSLAELYTGVQKKVSVSRRIVCRGCRLKPDQPQCKGCGRCPNEVKVENVQMGPFMTQQQVEVPSKEKCKQASEGIEVTVEKGMAKGERVSFPRMADQRPGMLPGDLILSLQVPKHEKFTRKGNDLHMDMTVTLRESLLGWKQTIRHLDGHTVEMNIESVTKSYQIIRVKGEGMPLRDDPGSFGDLFVQVVVDFPRELTNTQKGAVNAAFPVIPRREEL